MNKTKLISKLVLILALGIMIFSFIPYTQAGGPVNKRSIDDWLVPNPQGIPGWSDPNADLAFWPDADVVEAEWYGGFVLERELEDEQLMVTVYLNVINQPIFLRYAGNIIFTGFIEYAFQYKFRLDMNEYPYGDNLPPLREIRKYEWGQSFFVSFHGDGFGTFNEEAYKWGFISNANAIILVDQVVIFNAQTGTQKIPVETIELFYVD